MSRIYTLTAYWASRFYRICCWMIGTVVRYPYDYTKEELKALANTHKQICRADTHSANLKD